MDMKETNIDLNVDDPNEEVMWFFGDQSGNVVAKTMMKVIEEEQAIDALSLQVPHGSYTLGYFRSNGTQKVFNNSRQIV